MPYIKINIFLIRKKNTQESSKTTTKKTTLEESFSFAINAGA